MASARGRLTLGQFFAVCLLGLALLLAGLLSLLDRGSHATIVLAAQNVMERASRHVASMTLEHLAEAEQVVASFESRLSLDLVDPTSPESLAHALLAELAPHDDVTEASFTYARADGYYDQAQGPHGAGELRLLPGGRGEVAVTRERHGSSPDIVIRQVRQDDGRWHSERRVVRSSAPPQHAEASDPTEADTFTGASTRGQRGMPVWSDLFPSASAGGRRMVTVQKALWSRDGRRFYGVIKVALLSERIDAIVQQKVEPEAARDPHRVFLCDRYGRLVSRLDPADRLALLDEDGKPDEAKGDLRVVPTSLPPEVAAVLSSPRLEEVPYRGSTTWRLEVGRPAVPYLATVTAFPEGQTQDWLVALVVPERHYLQDLARSRRRLLAAAALIMLGIVAGGAAVLRALRCELGRLIRETTRLRSFDFAPSPAAPAMFRDVEAASQSLEQAKTALRALGKYVPLDLVRQLYEERREPTLGGQLQDVTIMFSDIEGFTTVSERLAPDALAIALGHYLGTMTAAVHGTGGIIDKYTGDGLMALWNTPTPLARHPAHACEAALRCIEATASLFASPAWGDLPPWPTRFGIHRAVVSVGHFGAPDRMSFTAMGDGVNLAARLEGLNKQYGTHVMVSAAVAAEVGDAFVLRRLDRVAVKGKHDGVEVYELCGRAGTAPAPSALAYEPALEAYFGRRFAEALLLLAAHPGDGPSRVLAARCRQFVASPPPTDWNGVYVAREK